MTVSAASLSRRRLEVLSLAATGLTDKEIAYHLRIAVRTVRFHFAASCRVLGARTRLQATALVVARGWVDPERRQLEAEKKRPSP